MISCQHPSRLLFAVATLAVTATLAFSTPALASASHARQQPSFQQPQPRPRGNPGTRIGPQGEHLPQWMTHHENQSLAQQQRALEQEPGFHDLPPETQQRMRNRLTQLNAMTPQRRKQLLARTEAMERLAPAQRQEVRSAMQGLASLPEDRRRLVARAFRDLRALLPQQRQYAFNTDPRYSTSFSPLERATLGNLLAVEPYLPAPQQRQPAVPYLRPNPYTQPGPYAPQPAPYR